MQNSPRHLETIDATRHGRPHYFGTLWSRKPSNDEESEEADESAAIDRTERALLAELQNVAERRRSLRASLSVRQPAEEAIEDAGGKGGKGSKGGKGGKGAQGTRPPWGCFVCGNTEKGTRECTCGPCANCLRRDCPGAPGAAAVTKLKCVFLLPKYPPQSEVRQAKGPLNRKMYEDLGHVYAKYFDVPYEVSELETVPEADEKGWTADGEASVLELELNATERDVANIGHVAPLHRRLELLGLCRAGLGVLLGVELDEPKVQPCAVALALH